MPDDRLYYKHNRELLPLALIDEFAAFCERDGFMRETPAGGYEVLRMWRLDSRKHRQYLIVHKKGSTLAGSPNVVHATVWGLSYIMARRFMTWRKQERVAEHMVRNGYL